MHEEGRIRIVPVVDLYFMMGLGDLEARLCISCETDEGSQSHMKCEPS